MATTATPHRDCPMAARAHAEHTFRIFGTMSPLDGATADCPGFTPRTLPAEDLKGGDRVVLARIGTVEVFDTTVYSGRAMSLVDVRFITDRGLCRSVALPVGTPVQVA